MRCITCSDEAFVGRVVEIDGATAVVAHEGERAEVALDLVEPVAVGDLLMCHAGIALHKLEPVR